MFAHLDDPEPFRPDDRFRAGVRRRAGHLRRRRRAVVAGVGALAMVGGVATGVVAYDVQRVARMRRVDVAALSPSDSPAQVILLVGTDQGLTGSASARADLVAFVRVDPVAHSISVLPVPRDLAMPSAGGPDGKVADLLAQGGPERLVERLKDALGVEAQHYVEMSPAGFRSIVDAVGGIRVSSTATLRDGYSGLAMGAGLCSRLDGDGALALARSRNVEVRLDGTWRAAGAGDLTRQRDAVVVASTILDALRRQGPDPVALQRLVDAFASHSTVDAGLGAGDLLDLARAARAVPAGSVGVAWLPVRLATTSGGRALVQLDAGWEEAVSRFLDGQSRDPSAGGPLPGGAPSFDRPEFQLRPC